MADDTEDRIRKRAYRLWEQEGRPEGRAEAHWELASELVAIEESQQDTLLPVRRDPETGEAIAESEPLEAVRNLGEFPTLTDQGEEVVYPDPALVKDADEPPLSVDPKAAKSTRSAKAPAAKTAAKPKRAPAKGKPASGKET